MSNIASVDSVGSVMLNGSRVGRVERRAGVGPRGGSVVEWVAHSPYVPSAVYGTRAAAASGVAAAWVAGAECPVCERTNDECVCDGTHADCPDCGERVEMDGLKPIHNTTGDASCPKRSTGAVAYGVKREVVEIDHQDFHDHTRATVYVRYTYPDAPDTALRVVFSQTFGNRNVWMQAGRMAAVMVDDPARFGDFASAPADWVHAFYADR